MSKRHRMHMTVAQLRDTIGDAASGAKKLAFYDFDDTLVRSPLPETGKAEWERKTGTPWPYAGWWGKTESLDPDVFSIELVDSVASRLRADRAIGAVTVLLTNRLPKFEKQIRRVLGSHGIELDMFTFMTAPKQSRVRAVVANHPGVGIVDVYDDDERNLEQVGLAAGELGCELRLFHVSKSGVVSRFNE